MFVLLAICQFSRGADRASIESHFYPEVAVADGNSVITITITVRDKNGGLVPDNTQVLVEAIQGSIKTPVLFTRGGTVQAQFVAGRVVGNARITISVIGFQATANLEIPLVKDRASLRETQESVSVIASNRATYSPELRIIRADGPGKLVKLKYGKIELLADDLEFRMDSKVVVAKKVTFIRGEISWKVEELYLNLKSGEGYALTDFDSKRVVVIRTWPYPTVEIIDGKRRGWYGVSNFIIGERTLAPAVELTQFTDLLTVSTLIYAKRIQAILGQEVIVQNASVDIAGTIIMRVPLMRLGYQSTSPIITDQFIQVGNNDLLIDFPYYLGLSLRSDSLIRLRYGTRFSRGTGGGGGLFVSYERNWQSSVEQRGGLSFEGISRKDWGLRARQSLPIGSSTSVYLQADFPSHRTILGSSFIESRILDWRLTHSLNGSKSIRGPGSASLDQSLNLTKSAQKLKFLPISFNYGLGWSTRESISDESNRIMQRSYGADASFNYSSPFTAKSNTNAFLRLSRRWGENIREGLTTSLSTTHSRSLAPGINFNIGYDFSDDPFSVDAIGKHRSSLSVGLSKGRLDVGSFIAKSLDVDRLNVQFDSNYRISGLWRLGYGATQDRFKGSNYTDQYFSVLYRLGIRDIGVSYSQRSKRFGFEIFSVGLR